MGAELSPGAEASIPGADSRDAESPCPQAKAVHRGCRERTHEGSMQGCYDFAGAENMLSLTNPRDASSSASSHSLLSPFSSGWFAETLPGKRYAGG